MTWSDFAPGWSIGIVKFSLMAAAPREPPNTRTSGRSGANEVPRVALMRAIASALDAGTSSSRALRSGSPVTAEGQCSVSALTAGKERAMPVAMRARCARGEKECESVPREIAVQALFALVYMAFIVVSSTTTGYDRIGNRLLAPAYPSMVLVLVYMLAHALRNLPKQTSRVISICVLSASLLCGLAWLGSRLPVSYLMLACAGCISSTLAFLLMRKGWTARDVAMFSLVVPLLLLSAVSAWSMMKSWMVHGSGMNSDYFFDPEMTEFLHLELTPGREIFCDEGRYAMDPTLNVRILPRSRHYQSVVPTGLTPENILDSRPELDGALLILRADTIPDGFVNLFDSGFSGRLDLLKRFRTGSVWEIRREEIEAVE